MCGLVITRSRPSTPASSSRGRPNVSVRLRSSTPTVTPGTGGIRKALKVGEVREVQEVRVVRKTREPLEPLEPFEPLEPLELQFDLDQRELVVAAAVHDVDQTRFRIEEDDDAVAGAVEHAGGVGDRQHLDGLARCS